MNTNQFLRTAAVAIMVVLVTMPQQAEAQKLKDFQEAMRTPRGYGNGYSLAKAYKDEKVRKVASENGFKILGTNSRGCAVFIPNSEYETYQRELKANAIMDDYNKNAIKENERLVIRNLKGSDFKSVGSAYLVYRYWASRHSADRFAGDWKETFILCNDIQWTGNAENGMIDGSGEGYAVTTEQGETVRFTISGTFKNGVIQDVLIKNLRDKHHSQTYRLSWFETSGNMIIYDYKNEDYKTKLIVDNKFSHIYSYGYEAFKKGIKDDYAPFKEFKFEANNIEYLATSENTAAISYYNGTATNFTIPESVTHNGKNYVVNEIRSLGNKFTTLTIPKTIAVISDNPLNETQNIVMEAGNSRYTVTNGVLIDQVERKLLRCPKGKMGTVSIPSSVKVIGLCAFRNCSKLTAVTIPSSVETIESSAFEGCKSLSSVSIPYSVKSIGKDAFAGCALLASASVPNSIENSIKGRSIFASCDKLKAVTIRNANGTKKQDNSWYWFKSSDPNATKPVYTASSSSSINPNTVSIPSYYTVEYGDWSKMSGWWSKKIVFSDGTKTFLMKKYENGRTVYWGEGVSMPYKTEQDAAAAVWVQLKYNKFRTIGLW